MTAPPTVDPPLSQVVGVGAIFERTCAFSGCHSGPAPQMGLDLRAGAYRASTVGVTAKQAPGLHLVTPGRPDSSYLMMKLDGVAGAVGGIGTQMPLGGQLTTSQLDSVRTWIQNGAPTQ